MSNPYEAPQEKPSQRKARGTSIRFWLILAAVGWVTSYGLRLYQAKLQEEIAVQQQQEAQRKLLELQASEDNR